MNDEQAGFALYEIPIKFYLHQSKQMLLIKVLLSTYHLSLEKISRYLDVSMEALKEVLKKKRYFDLEKSKKLVELFCLVSGA